MGAHDAYMSLVGKGLRNGSTYRSYKGKLVVNEILSFLQIIDGHPL